MFDDVSPHSGKSSPLVCRVASLFAFKCKTILPFKDAVDADGGLLRWTSIFFFIGEFILIRLTLVPLLSGFVFHKLPTVNLVD